MDLKGTWQTENGDIVEVEYYVPDSTHPWRGRVVKKLEWDISGNNVDPKLNLKVRKRSDDDKRFRKRVSEAS